MGARRRRAHLDQCWWPSRTAAQIPMGANILSAIRLSTVTGRCGGLGQETVPMPMTDSQKAPDSR